MSSTIVVPLSGPRTDRSRLSERAIPFARSLARRSKSSVLLVSVVDVPAELAELYSVSTTDSDPESGPLAERKHYLQQLAESFDGSPVQTIVPSGDPAEEVISVAEQQADPVIVLASHAHIGPGRSILGSVAFSIIHGVRCPVLVVPTPVSDFHVPVLPDRGTILVPLDGSFYSETALNRPLRLLGKPDFALHLLFVVVPATDADGMPIEAFVGPKEEWATHYLQGVADRLSTQGHLVTWSVKIGEAAEQILAVADEIDADLISMATHGRHGVGRMLFGSVTERLAHEAGVPILLIHPEFKASKETHDNGVEEDRERRTARVGEHATSSPC